MARQRVNPFTRGTAEHTLFEHFRKANGLAENAEREAALWATRGQAQCASAERFAEALRALGHGDKVTPLAAISFLPTAGCQMNSLTPPEARLLGASGPLVQHHAGGVGRVFVEEGMFASAQIAILRIFGLIGQLRAPASSNGAIPNNHEPGRVAHDRLNQDAPLGAPSAIAGAAALPPSAAGGASRIPRIDIARWGGQCDGLHDYNGWSIAIEWLGLIVEFNGGRARP